MMLKEGATDKYQGNDKYMGYCVDLLEKISDMCGFNYTIKLVDGKDLSNLSELHI